MMHDNVFAAATGALASSLSYYKRGFVVMLQVFISGFFLSYFGSVNVIDWLKINWGVLTSYSICYFLVAYFGNLILDRIGTWIKAVRVKLWSK